MLSNYLKRGAYNTFFYGLSSAFNRSLNFLFFPYFLSVLTLTELGIWDFYQTFFSLGTTLLISCASASFIRYYFLYKNDYSLQRIAIGNACLMALGTILFFILSIFIGFYFNFFSCNNHLILTIANTSLFSLFSLTLAYLRVKENLFIFCTLSIGQSLLTTILTLIALYFKWGISSFFYANLFSLALFFPIFIYFFSCYSSFCPQLFKKQLYFSIPLLAYNLIFMIFINCDRFFIKQWFGYEQLGVYSIFVRFGVLFQFFSLALIEAWPVILYNAEKESNRRNLVTNLINYYILVLTILSLTAIAGSHFLITFFIPSKYHYIISHLPLYFSSLLLLDIARVFQTGFCVSTKTFFTPILILMSLGIQICIYYLLSFFTFNLTILLLANNSAFGFYALITYLYERRSAESFINGNRILSQLVIAYCYFILFYLLYCYTTSILMCLTILTTVPFAYWFGYIKSYEKEAIAKKITSFFFRTTESKPEQRFTHTYSQHVKNEKVLICGPYPPPLGGISIHIKRVKQILESHSNETFIFDSTAPSRLWILHCSRLIHRLLSFKPTLIYYHTSYAYYALSELTLLALYTYLCKKKLILIEHDCRYFSSQSSRFKMIYTIIIASVSEQWFMGEKTYEHYCENNIRILPNAFIESPYVPPNKAEEQSIIEHLPSELFNFIDSHYPLLAANAFQLVLLNNRDLYGIDLCIELIAQLKTIFPNIGFILALAQQGNQTYFNQLMSNIRSLQIEHNIYILQGQKEYWPILKRVDLFVRPTLSDNFGISIAEALEYNVVTLASDICKRPASTHLFKCNDKNDFFNKALLLLEHHKGPLSKTVD